MRLLAGLGHEHRTAVFGMMDGQVLFWYVRIREQRHLDYPLMGVIKVEMPNPSMEPVDSELVDWLSRALVAERTVTPYGRDSRWHAHLYSIWLAERYVQNAFLSREVMRSMVKWDIRR
ncbi:MAG TPA: hypothetical protein EYP10_10655 [Armatimonadetes bacterium]|nr:hypothetical protein [Armatimonadota bacterium]